MQRTANSFYLTKRGEVMNRWSSFVKRVVVSFCVVGAFAGVAFSADPVPGPRGKEQFVPMLTFRVGPFGFVGSAFGAGTIDYMDMLNKRDGGINGVKLSWEECEFEYKTDLGVACYEKLKKKGSTGAT